MEPQNFRGKVYWVGDVKQFKKGVGMGFKIEGFDGFLNIFRDREDRIPEITKGQIVEGIFLRDGDYNIVQTIQSVAKFETADQNVADFVEEKHGVDTSLFVAYNTKLLEACWEEFQKTKVFQYFKDNPEELQDILVTLFLTTKRDLQ